MKWRKQKGLGNNIRAKEKSVELLTIPKSELVLLKIKLTALLNRMFLCLGDSQLTYSSYLT